MKLVGVLQLFDLGCRVILGSWIPLFASSGIEAEIVAAAESIDITKNLRLPIARTGHLLALKLLARDDVNRPQDFVDIRALLQEVDDAELDITREAISLIESRGYARDRDLQSNLKDILENH